MDKICYLKNNEIVFRGESFGGIAFNKKKALTLELDSEAFYLLHILKQCLSLTEIKQCLTKKFHRVFDDFELNSMLKYYCQEGFVKISESPKQTENGFLKKSTQNIFETNGSLSAPETVHLSITGKCNLNCPFCYGKNKTKDLSTEQVFRLIDELSILKVFQLAIGGGEPFLRKDIFKVIDYCQQKNIVVNITSNGTLITEEIARKIRNKIGQINLSYNESISKKGTKEFERALKILLKNKVNVGINLLITKGILLNLDKIIKELLRYKIAKIVVLRPKPGNNKKWFEKNKLTKKELLKLKGTLNKYSKINVDCSLTCLMQGIPKQELTKEAIYGCVAGARFCTIKNNGDVFPCSFFSFKDFLAGNILTSEFKGIWLKAEIFKKFRDMNNKIKGECGSCEIRDNCKGCRRIALESIQDFYGEEKECIKGI